MGRGAVRVPDQVTHYPPVETALVQLFDLPFATLSCNRASHASYQLKQTKKHFIMDNNVREVLMAPAVLGSLGAAVYFFVKAMTDYILKKKMIEKGFVNDEAQAIFKQEEGYSKYSSLKWGLIILFGGIALILMEYIPAGHESPLPYGILAVAVSLGFLIYYYLVREKMQK